MAINDTDYDEDLYTDTSMFDADEIVRSVEEVALEKKKAAENQSARRRFEAMMEDRKLAAELEDAYDEEWDATDAAWDEDSWT